MGRPRKNEIESPDPMIDGLIESEVIEGNLILSPADGEAQMSPTMDDPAWQDYVMSHFVEDELDNGYPKVKGLARVVRKLLGPVIDGRGHAVQHPNESNDYRATVEYTLVINQVRNLNYDEEPGLRTFTSIGDAYHENINGPKDFKVCQPRIAESRAEARACRHALNLYVVAAEELASTSGFPGPITENQITKIDIKCSQLDVDVMKFMNQYRGSRKAPKYESIEEVSFDSARAAFELLNKYQQKVEEIPATVVGYKTSWRTNS